MLRSLWFENAPKGPGITIPAGWDMAQRDLETRLDAIVTYYRNNIFSRPNDDLLVQILQTGLPARSEVNGFPSFTSSWDSFFEASLTFVPSLVRTFGLTTSYNFGKLHRVLNQKEGLDILFEVSAWGDYRQWIQNWKTLAPLQIVKSGTLSQAFFPPTMVPRKTPLGVSVATINIVQLFVQYRCWWEEWRGLEARPRINPSYVFLTQWVLPNALRSYFNAVTVARWVNALSEVPIKDTSNLRHALAIASEDTVWTRESERIITAGVAQQNEQNLPPRTLLQTWKVPFGTTVYDFLFPIKSAPTLQFTGTFLYAYWPLLKALWQWEHRRNRGAHGSVWTPCWQEYQIALSQRGYRRILPPAEASRFETDVTQVLEGSDEPV